MVCSTTNLRKRLRRGELAKALLARTLSSSACTTSAEIWSGCSEPAFPLLGSSRSCVVGIDLPHHLSQGAVMPQSEQRRSSNWGSFSDTPEDCWVPVPDADLP